MPETPARNPELDAIGSKIFTACQKSRVAFLGLEDLKEIGTRLGDIATTPAELSQAVTDEFDAWLNRRLLVDPPEPVQE